MIFELMFWILVFLVMYTYFLYPLSLLVVSLFKTKDIKVFTYNHLPTVSLIISSHNNATIIEEKLQNCLKFNYPKDKMEIIIADDASTDNTPKLISKYKQIKLLRIFEKKGKTHAIKMAASLSRGNILIFTDVDSYHNSNFVSNFISHFEDLKVGCVTSETSLIPKGGSYVSGAGLFSKYEGFIQDKESILTSAISINSASFALRRELYVPFKKLYPEDFITTINVIKHGYKVIYDKTPCWKYHTTSIRKEIKRKSKIIAGGFHSIPYVLSIKQPLFLFQLFSHKILRWMVPEMLVSILIINWFLLSIPIYQSIFVLQLLFYIFYPFCVLMSSLRLFSLPSYFFVMNISSMLGFFRFITRTD